MDQHDSSLVPGSGTSSNLAATHRRRRGTHSTRCKNRNPSYTVPDSHESRGRLKFICELVEKSQSRDITRSDEVKLAHGQRGRARRMYSDRAKAIRALFSVFCEHVNLVTFQPEISLRNASDAAGLSTISDAEKAKAKEDPTYTPVVNISRASRAFRDMVELGLLISRPEWQVWDKEAGCWIDKYFEVTPLFFNAAGITTERVERQQSARLGFLKNKALSRGLSAEEVGRMSISQIKAEKKLQWRRNAFERRCKEGQRKALKRRMHDKTREEHRELAINRVMASLQPHELQSITPQQFKDLVNKEVAMLRKFTDIPPPTH